MAQRSLNFPRGAILKTLLTHIRSRRRARPISSVPSDPLAALRVQFPDISETQLQIYDSVSELTMTSPERVFALCHAVEYLAKNQILGDFVECGVWRGGSMAAAAQMLVHLADLDRTLWMYDTFQGMSEPTAVDVDLRGAAASRLLSEQDRLDEQSIWCYSPLDQVRETMRQTGYPEEKIRFVKGKVEETLGSSKPEQIALLRLDTDWYESTKCEMEHLFPRLVTGGVIVIDDYGHWEGCRRAVDEYLEQHGIQLFLNRIDYTGRVGIKIG